MHNLTCVIGYPGNCIRDCWIDTNCSKINTEFDCWFTKSIAGVRGGTNERVEGKRTYPA